MVNGIAQNYQATQEAIQQLLDQGIQGGQPPMESQLLDDLEVSEDLHKHVAIVPPPPPAAPALPWVFTLEKFIKNGAKYFKGTAEPHMAKTWVINRLKTLRAMEVPGNHWVRLGSYMFEEEVVFWLEAT